MSTLTLENVNKRYGTSTLAVDDLSFHVDDGEFLVLVGPSGCGKSTVLKMIAGLEDASEGEIRIDGQRVNEYGPRERDVAMVFQNYALYPHLTVRKNIAYPLKVARVGAAEREQRVAETAELLQITDLLDRRPSELSGGQRQRVAMGRAIVRRPTVFLMDEPLSNLDARLRVQMRAEISNLQRELGITTIYVTHDQVEAMTMGSQVAVLLHGRLQQLASPRGLYDRPANRFVAGFMGSPPMNLLEATLASVDGSPSLEVGGELLVVPKDLVPTGLQPGDRVVVGLRPEDLTLGPGGSGGAGAGDRAPSRTLPGTVRLVEELGAEEVVHLRLGPSAGDRGVPVADMARAEDDDELGPADGDERIAPLVVRTSGASGFALGDDAQVTVDSSRLHLFDAETGAAL